MIKRLDHADIIIPKGGEDTARRYYCEILGLREIEKPEALKKNGGLWIQLNGSQLHLSHEKKDQLPGMARMETEDPFGHRIEFLQLL